MKEISALELKAKIDNKEAYQLIDVREVAEYEQANIGAELMPLATIVTNADRIAKDKPVVIHCRSGKRSAFAISELESRFGYTNLYNLTGGILAYAKDVDPTLNVH